jgi:hypothetical protein
MTRFRALVKHLTLPEMPRPEPMLAHTLPVLVYYGMDADAGGSEASGPFVMMVRGDMGKDEGRGRQNATDLAKDTMFADEEIDRLVQNKERARG